jgi:hypothetical protein
MKGRYAVAVGAVLLALLVLNLGPDQDRIDPNPRSGSTPPVEAKR